MLNLNNLEKLHKARKRVGRGGDLGGTSGKGHKGQKARSGGYVGRAFEGGQMSLSRRLPKRGFNNSFQKRVVKVINLSELDLKFEKDEIVNLETLRNKGIIKGNTNLYVKILGKGVLTKSLDVHANNFSQAAAEAIKAAGGKVNVIQER